MSKFFAAALISLMALPYALFCETRWVITILCLLYAVYGGYHLTFEAGRREGLRQHQEAVAAKIRAIKAEQENGFSEKANQEILKLQQGR